MRRAALVPCFSTISSRSRYADRTPRPSIPKRNGSPVWRTPRSRLPADSENQSRIRSLDTISYVSVGKVFLNGLQDPGSFGALGLRGGLLGCPAMKTPAPGPPCLGVLLDQVSAYPLSCPPLGSFQNST